MTDLLGRLAARVLAPERAIRPRVHSPFESYEPDVVAEESRTSLSIEQARTAQKREERAAVPVLHTETEVVREVVRDETQPPLVIERTVRDEAPAPEPAPPHVETRTETETILRDRHTVERSERTERVDRLHVHRERERVDSFTLRDRLPVTTPVEITIGRIDVRAVVGGTAPAPPRQREKPATMSLRDYLARRDERRRR